MSNGEMMVFCPKCGAPLTFIPTIASATVYNNTVNYVLHGMSVPHTCEEK